MAVSSPVTKRNPRPRKYASAAARQAAYRTRNEMLEFRAEPHTAEILTRIADTIDVSRSDLLLSMVKFALANHDWARFGLTHKTIPYYQGNPIMIPKLKRHVGSYAVVEIKTGKIVTELQKDSKLLDKINFDKYKLVPIDEWLASLSRKENPTMKKPTAKQLEARARFAEMARAGAFKKRKNNPRKKNVSQKISQLVREGYPQKQAVAVALSEEREGKVKSNPREKITWTKSADGKEYAAQYKGIEGVVTKYDGEWSLFLPDVTKKYWPTSNGKLSGAKAWLEVVVDNEAWEDQPVRNNPIQGEQHLFGNKYATIRQDGDGRFVAQVYEKVKTGIGEEIDYWGSRYYKTHAGAQRYLDSLKPVRNNPQKRKVSAVVLMNNPSESRVTVRQIGSARSKKKSNFPYIVQYKNTGSGEWHSKAALKTLTEAKDIAHAFAKQYPALTIRVLRHTGGPM